MTDRIWECPCGKSHHLGAAVTGYICAFCRAPENGEIPAAAAAPSPVQMPGDTTTPGPTKEK